MAMTLPPIIEFQKMENILDHYMFPRCQESQRNRYTQFFTKILHDNACALADKSPATKALILFGCYRHCMLSKLNRESLYQQAYGSLRNKLLKYNSDRPSVEDTVERFCRNRINEMHSIDVDFAITHALGISIKALYGTGYPEETAFLEKINNHLF